jgi:hypothetical protein
LERTDIGRNFLLLKKDPEIKEPKHYRDHVHSNYGVWTCSIVMGQRAVIRFLTFKKLPARDIAAELEGVYEHEALSFGGEEVAQAVHPCENHPGRRLTVRKTASKPSL